MSLGDAKGRTVSLTWRMGPPHTARPPQNTTVGGKPAYWSDQGGLSELSVYLAEDMAFTVLARGYSKVEVLRIAGTVKVSSNKDPARWPIDPLP